MDVLLNKIYRILTNNDKKIIKGIINDSSNEYSKLERISKIITNTIVKYRIKADPHRQDYIVSKIKSFLTEHRFLVGNDFRILDVGGGNGNVISCLKNKLDKSLSNEQFICLETISDWCENYAFDNKDIIYKFWQNQVIDMPDASADIAFCMVSLHHMKDETINNVLQELFRILKPGGKIFVKEHNNKNSETFRHILWEHHLYHLLDCAYNSSFIDVNKYYENSIYNFKSKEEWNIIFQYCGYKLLCYTNRFLDGDYVDEANNVTELYWAIYEK
jgi:ubiquinone/menaquinone biosynthesis C-methylase UbiE